MGSFSSITGFSSWLSGANHNDAENAARNRTSTTTSHYVDGTEAEIFGSTVDPDRSAATLNDNTANNRPRGSSMLAFAGNALSAILPRHNTEKPTPSFQNRLKDIISKGCGPEQMGKLEKRQKNEIRDELKELTNIAKTMDKGFKKDFDLTALIDRAEAIKAEATSDNETLEALQDIKSELDRRFFSGNFLEIIAPINTLKKRIDMEIICQHPKPTEERVEALKQLKISINVLYAQFQKDCSYERYHTFNKAELETRTTPTNNQSDL